MNRINVNLLEQRLINSNPQKKINNKSNLNNNFADILNNVKEQEDLKFSKHAKMRLNDRNINLSKSDIEKLSSALKEAEKKGVEDALILMENQAFIANVSNRIVITAIEDKDMKDNVFTNIDGAVII